MEASGELECRDSRYPLGIRDRLALHVIDVKMNKNSICH
jgi:hypothetical protein